MKVEFNGKQWQWNPLDKKLLQVNDWIEDLYAALEFVPKDRRRVAVQAGGAMGIWPHEMSKYFEWVYTFEPDAGNYACLKENLADRDNITHMCAALGLVPGLVRVELPPSEQGNAGAFYTMPATDNDGVPQYTIDGFTGAVGQHVDFIQLDVEGREMCVLGGAIETIQRDQPIIMLEDKPLPQDKHTGHVFGQVERLLTREFGYRVVKKVHRDIIFVPSVLKD